MAKPRSRDSGRFRIYVSDRSGFEFGFLPITSRPNTYTREAGKPVKDLSSTVSPEEFDSPPPSRLPLGGQGDISSGNVRPNSNFSTASNVFVVPPESARVTILVNSSTQIAWNQEPWTQIAGNVASLTMAVNPQVTAGLQSQQITLLCVSNQITLINGSGLSINSSKGAQFVMTSGSIINLMYGTGDLSWRETSRSSQFTDLGI